MTGRGCAGHGAVVGWRTERHYRATSAQANGSVPHLGAAHLLRDHRLRTGSLSFLTELAISATDDGSGERRSDPLWPTHRALHPGAGCSPIRHPELRSVPSDRAVGANGVCAVRPGAGATMQPRSFTVSPCSARAAGRHHAGVSHRTDCPQWRDRRPAARVASISAGHARGDRDLQRLIRNETAGSSSALLAATRRAFPLSYPPDRAEGARAPAPGQRNEGPCPRPLMSPAITERAGSV